MILKTALRCVSLLLEKDSVKIIYEGDSSRNWNVKHVLNREEDKVSLPESQNEERKAENKEKICNGQTRH